MDGNRLLTLAEPTGDRQAATKYYVDTNLNMMFNLLQHIIPFKVKHNRIQFQNVRLTFTISNPLLNQVEDPNQVVINYNVQFAGFC